MLEWHTRSGPTWPRPPSAQAQIPLTRDRIAPLPMIAPPYESPRRGRLRLLVLAGLALLAVWLLWELVTWPDVAALTHSHPKTTAFIEAYRGWGLFGKKREVEWTWVPYSRISSNLKRAVIASEDIRFFSHGGFDDAEIK